jgi:peptidoglycan/LPS O-acetylase OafA/YrhL
MQSRSVTLSSSLKKVAGDDLVTTTTGGQECHSVVVGGGRIWGFDGLRAIAFLLVFASHKIAFKHADSVGDVGVGLFFVLSGFLITRLLAQSRARIESGDSTVADSIGCFYFRRTARIFPPYYLLLASFAVVAFFVPVANFGYSERLAFVFYGTNFLIAARGDWLGDFGHLWTLAIEEQFYLFFAPLILLIPRRFAFGVCLAFISAGILTEVALAAAHASAVAIDVNSLVNFALLGFGGAIGLGASLGAPKWFVCGAAQATTLCLYLALPAVFGTWHQGWLLLGKLTAVLAGILLFQIFLGQQSWFVSALQISPIRRIGRISYGAYLIHHFIHFSMIVNFLRRIEVEITAPRLVQVLAELAISLMLAAFSWRYLERPIVGWASRVTLRSRP